MEFPATRSNLGGPYAAIDRLDLDERHIVQWPFLIVLWRNLNGEKMTVKFEPADGGGTHVRIKGAVGRAKQPLAADPGRSTGQP